MFSPPTIASLALQAVVVSQPVLPPIVPCTTFASISNVTATVYTAEVGLDDLSTRALEDALLPPLPPSQPSHPLTLSFSAPSPHTNVIHSNGSTYWGPGKNSEESCNSTEKSEPTQIYGNEVNMTEIKEENFGNLVKMEKSNVGVASAGAASHSEYQRLDESRAGGGEGGGGTISRDSVGSSNGEREKEREKIQERERGDEREIEREDERDGEKEKESQNENDVDHERERERDRETNLNMNGEPINITETECESRGINQPMDEE